MGPTRTLHCKHIKIQDKQKIWDLPLPTAAAAAAVSAAAAVAAAAATTTLGRLATLLGRVC